MQVIGTYDSPLGRLWVTGVDDALTALYFECQMRSDVISVAPQEMGSSPVLVSVKQWLDAYFSGEAPTFTPPLHLIGTPFQMEVWELLLKIPYGETVTYGALARTLALRHGARMSAQAVGGAVGRNPISIIVPCHRVVGADRSLTGYAGGIERKQALLLLERHTVSLGKVRL